MKKLILCSVLVIAFNAIQAQEVVKGNSKTTTKSTTTATSQYSKPSRDYVMLQAGYNSWLLPNDSTVYLKNRGHSIGIYMCYDFPIKKTNLSFAAGFGVGSNNVFLDSMVVNLADTSAGIRFPYDAKDYKRFKLSSNYLEAPFELRYFQNQENRNKGFKAAIGLKAGVLVNLHTKGVTNTAVKDKTTYRRYFERWRYAATARVGYGNFSIYGSYQLNNLFDSQSLQGVRPISIGICISGL